MLLASTGLSDQTCTGDGQPGLPTGAHPGDLDPRQVQRATTARSGDEGVDRGQMSGGEVARAGAPGEQQPAQDTGAQGRRQGGEVGGERLGDGGEGGGRLVGERVEVVGVGAQEVGGAGERLRQTRAEVLGEGREDRARPGAGEGGVGVRRVVPGVEAGGGARRAGRRPVDLKERAGEGDAPSRRRRGHAGEGAGAGAAQESQEDLLGLVVAGVAEQHEGGVEVAGRGGERGVAGLAGVGLGAGASAGDADPAHDDDLVGAAVGGAHRPALIGGTLGDLGRPGLQVVVDDDDAGAGGSPFVQEGVGEGEGVRSPADGREDEGARGFGSVVPGHAGAHRTSERCLRRMSCCHRPMMTRHSEGLPMRVRSPFVLALAALALAGCGTDDPTPAATGSSSSSSMTSASSSSSPAAEEDHDDEHEGEEGHEHEGEHEHEAYDHLDVACEAELSQMQGEEGSGQVLSASVEPDLTCAQAVPVVTAISALHPVGGAPTTLTAKGFECEVEQDDPDGMQVEVFRCTDDRGVVVWARTA